MEQKRATLLEDTESIISNYFEPMREEEDFFEVKEISEALDQMASKQQFVISHKDVDDLIAMCLYYEDLYHNRDNVVTKSLIKSAYYDIVHKVTMFEKYCDKLKILSENITSDDQFMYYVEQLHRELSNIEKTINSK